MDLTTLLLESPEDAILGAHRTGDTWDDDKPALSYSSLYPFFGKHGCSMEYYHKKILGRRGPANVNMAFGIALESAIEANLLSKVSTQEDLPVADVVQAFVETFREQLSRDDLVLRGDDDPPDLYLSDGIVLVRLYMEQEAPYLMPQSQDDIQRPFRLVVPHEPYDLRGRIDYCGHYLDPSRESIAGRTVLDWKGKGKAFQAGEIQNDQQLTLYRIAFGDVFMDGPTWLGYHQLVRPGSVKAGYRRLGEDMATGEHRWPASVLTKTGKVAKAQPTPPQVIASPAERTASDVRWFWQCFHEAVQAIEAGVFLPVHPSHWKCSPGKCDFFDVCRGAVHRGGSIDGDLDAADAVA